MQISTDKVHFSTVGDAPTNATAATVSGLSADVTYYFRVQTTNGKTNSGYSNVATATTP